MRPLTLALLVTVLGIDLAAAQQPSTAGALFTYAPRDEAMFEAGYQRHLDWHRAAEDSLTWYGWDVAVGPRPHLFVDGVFGVPFAALDARVDPAGDQADAAVNVLPHADAASREIVALRRDLSSATPLEDGTPSRMVEVVRYDVTPGETRHVEAALSALRARAAGGRARRRCRTRLPPHDLAGQTRHLRRSQRKSAPSPRRDSRGERRGRAKASQHSGFDERDLAVPTGHDVYGLEPGGTLSEERSSMSIGEVAAATGLTVHSLRYYEAEGLIPQVRRNGSGHRRYRGEHIRWIGLLERLRVSGMSIARMRHYAELALRGDVTIPARQALLEEHEADLLGRIQELEDCRAIIRAKIDLYGGESGDIGRVWALVEQAQERRRRSGPSGVRAGGR